MNVTSSTIRTSCRACESRRLSPVLSLGNLPLANGLLTADRVNAAEPRFPLDLVFCADCALVQITATVPADDLFRDYAYVSSVSDTAVRSAEALVTRTIARHGLTSSDLAVEIASNDGYLLQHYRDRGVKVLGVDPARNIAAIAEQRGIATVPEFFSAALAVDLRERGHVAGVLHANNVLAHVPDLPGVLRGIATLLEPGGRAIIEVPYVRDLIERLEFDTIYHEHLCYFSLTALSRACSDQGLTVCDVERIPIHGGSLRVTACLSRGTPSIAPAVAALIAEEDALGMRQLSYYTGFAANVENLRARLRMLLADLKATGHRIAAYGASAKGATLLNYCRIGSETIDFVVDRSPLKQGRFTPGTHLPIESPDALLVRRPDYTLLLTWNFAEEILEQQHAYTDHGGQFIVPLPVPAVLEAVA
ncbi:MAG TPA: class I SAM-dependent methyltransferase [Vicinamibacterales bacterium]